VPDAAPASVAKAAAPGPAAGGDGGPAHKDPRTAEASAADSPPRETGTLPPASSASPEAMTRTDPMASAWNPAGETPAAGVEPRQRLDPVPRADAVPDLRMAPPTAAPAPPPEATPAETPRAPPPSAPARQVLPAVVAVAIGGGGRITVTLEPGELGRVEISIERSAEAPQVVILAERPETLALLQRDQRELDRALTQAGLQAEGRALSFGLSSGDGGSHQPQRRRDAHAGDRSARGVQSLDATTSLAAAPARRLAVSLLDLAI
jgi:Meckel syndrome type 1 protein